MPMRKAYKAAAAVLAVLAFIGAVGLMVYEFPADQYGTAVVYSESHYQGDHNTTYYVLQVQWNGPVGGSRVFNGTVACDVYDIGDRVPVYYSSALGSGSYYLDYGSMPRGCSPY